MNIQATAVFVIVQSVLFYLSLCYSHSIDDEKNPKFFSHSRSKNTLSPIILIPGSGGNQLQAKLNKDYRPHWYCSKTSNWYEIWMDPRQLLPYKVNCWIDNMKLQFNDKINKSENTPGVDVRLVDWGQTTSMEFLSTFSIFGKRFIPYFMALVSDLLEQGYVRNSNLFGAPYDFRKGPNENAEWFEELVVLTEKAYATNQNTSVTFIAHSLGGRMLLMFLQKRPQSWKDKYVKRIITLGVPWAGSVKAIEVLSHGYDFDYPILPREKMRQVQETLPSVVWLLPSSNFWQPNETLATIGEKQYSMANIDDFFYDIGIPNIVKMRRQILTYDNLSAPGVEVHCLYSSTEEGSVEQVKFDFVGSKPNFKRGSGDGTVNRRSLQECGSWRNLKSQKNHKVYAEEFHDVLHYDIVSDSSAINYILKTIFNKSIRTQSTNKFENMKNVMWVRFF